MPSAADLQANLKGSAMASVLPFRPADRARRSAQAQHPLLGALTGLFRRQRLEAELRGLAPRMLRDIGLEPVAAPDPLRRPGL
jgi:hypothetical protein